MYIGIDPGSNGGVAWIAGERGVGGVPPTTTKVEACRMPDTERDRWDLIMDLTCGEASTVRRYAVIEQQTPRPTRYRDKKTGVYISTVLASTSILYGSYMQMRAFLTAAEIPYEDVPPKRWQVGMKIVRGKDEASTTWKNRLKTRAQQLFPDVRVTLYTADALLMAEYCRRIHEWTLER